MSDFSTLIETLASVDRPVRWQAIQALIAAGAPAAPALIDALNSPEGAIREGAATALSRMGEPASAPLIAALDAEADRVRSFAVWALGEAGDPRAVPALIARATDSHPRVRSRSLWALARICIPLRDAALNEAILPPMLAGLNDPRRIVRQTAAEALARLADPAAVPALVAALADPDPRVRENVVMALGRTEDESALDALLAATQDADVWVRICAARALVTTPEETSHGGRIVSALAALLRDTSTPIEGERVCDVAADALRTLGTPEALAALRRWRRTRWLSTLLYRLRSFHRG
jgi:HEAT repeat protein